MKEIYSNAWKLRPQGRWLAVGIAVFLISGLAFCTFVSAAAGQVTLDIGYGYDDTAKGGRYLPVDVTVNNNQHKELSGTLRVKAQESDGTLYHYDYQVEAGVGESRLFRYYIPLGIGADQLIFSLIDGQNGPILNKKVELNVSQDVPELFIGILSDEPAELLYFNGVGVHYSTLRTRTFDLNAEDFPEDQMGLDLLDVLVVNNYRLRNLSERQTAVVMDWVHDGGVLILGTGDRVDDTLGRFAPELLDDSYGVPNIRHINLGEGFAALDEPGEGMLAISCVDIPLHGGNVILASNRISLLTAAVKGQGMVAVAAFDLGDISDFCEKRASYVDHIFTSLLGESRINRLAEMSYGGNSGRFWSVQSLINTGDVDKLPNLMLYVLVVTVYLAFLGPGLYLFLKGRELGIYYRRSVAALSFLFAGIIYMMGATTRFRSTFFTYATIQDVTDDYINDTTYINIRNPYNRPYTVELNPDYSLLPVTRSYQNEEIRRNFTPQDPFQISISRDKEEVTVQGQNITAFAPRYFCLQRKSENTQKVGVSGEVDYFEGKISGTLTNQFPFPLENTTLILFGNMVQLERMEPGETKNLADYQLLRFPLGNSYAVANRVSGEGRFGGADISDKKYLLAMERSNMLKFYLDNYMGGYTADARIIAFSTQKEEGEFLKNLSAETYGLTMLTSSVPVNASRDRMLYRSVLIKTPKVISGSYDETNNSMNSSEPLTLEYQIGTNIDVESLTFENVSEEFTQVGSGDFSKIFTGSIYFYSYISGNFEQVGLENQTMDLARLRPYLSPGNTLTVRYAYDGGSGYGAIQLPMPMVAGRER